MKHCALIFLFIFNINIKLACAMENPESSLFPVVPSNSPCPTTPRSPYPNIKPQTLHKVSLSEGALSKAIQFLKGKKIESLISRATEIVLQEKAIQQAIETDTFYVASPQSETKSRMGTQRSPSPLNIAQLISSCEN
jgi:hypothetical protein